MSDWTFVVDDDGWYAALNSDGRKVVLAEDEEESLRIIALRLNLDEWVKPVAVSTYDDKYVIVNERTVKDGMSFEEAYTSVELLRDAINKTQWIRFGTNSAWTAEINGEMSAQRLCVVTALPGTNFAVYDQEDRKRELDRHASEAYGAISSAMMKAVPHALEVGTHTMVNTLYHITSGYNEKQWHCRLLRAMWNREEIEDARPNVMTNDGEYLVVLDHEADELWEADLDSYIDDCLDIPAHIKPYFDEKKWKADARADGRANSLSRYDGREDSVNIDSESVTYFIYRTN